MPTGRAATASPPSNTAAFASAAVKVDGVEFKTDWVYRFRLPRPRDIGAIKREWARFDREVERLAA